MTKFTIDFFEYSFLLEACIPPRPIARTFFWKNSINIDYYRMTSYERNNLYEWISRNSIFQKGLQTKDEDVLHWEARYNPDNQYKITLDFGEQKECYKLGDKYYRSQNKYILNDYIEKVEKICVR